MGAVPQQLPMWYGFALRIDGVKGAYSRNVLKENRADGEWVQRRNGLGLVGIDASAAGGWEVGIFSTERFELISGAYSYLNSVLAFVNSAVNFTGSGNIYAVGNDGVPVLLPGAATFAQDPFSIITDSNTPSSCVAVCGTNGWTMTVASGSCVPTEILAINFGVGKGLVYLDGTYYVMSTTTSAIRGSALQDPTTWSALNSVSGSLSWGPGRAVSRHLNYVLGFYERGLQVFYNAGLAPPGSPLAPLPNASFLIGTKAGQTIVSMADVTIFVGLSAAGNRSVYMLSGLSLSIISNPAIDAFLLKFVQDSPGTESGWLGYTLVDKGHTLYVLKLRTWVGAAPVTAYQDEMVLVYDLSSQEWCMYSSGVEGVEVPFLPNYTSANYCIGHARTVSFYDDALDADSTGPIRAETTGIVMDFKSAYKKFIHKFSLHGDSIVGTATCEYSDDDYTTYSAAIGIDLSKQRKMINRQGSFYQRSYRIRYSGSNKYRLRAMEVLVEGGGS